MVAEKYKESPFSSCMAITQTFDAYYTNFQVTFFLKINIIIIDENKMNERVYLQALDNSIRLQIRKENFHPLNIFYAATKKFDHYIQIKNIKSDPLVKEFIKK